MVRFALLPSNGVGRKADPRSVLVYDLQFKGICPGKSQSSHVTVMKRGLQCHSDQAVQVKRTNPCVMRSIPTDPPMETPPLREIEALPCHCPATFQSFLGPVQQGTPQQEVLQLYFSHPTLSSHTFCVSPHPFKTLNYVVIGLQSILW